MGQSVQLIRVGLVSPIRGSSNGHRKGRHWEADATAHNKAVGVIRGAYVHL